MTFPNPTPLKVKQEGPNEQENPYQQVDRDEDLDGNSNGEGVKRNKNGSNVGSTRKEVKCTTSTPRCYP